MTVKVKDYRKRPVIVQAVEFVLGEHTKREWLEFVPTANIGTLVKDFENDPEAMESKDIRFFLIPTLEGDMEVSDGDYIIQGIAGEFYPCKPEVFKKSYESA